MSTKPLRASMANPASLYCINHGGRSEIRRDEKHGEYGVCIFPDGSECEQWEFMRGLCKIKKEITKEEKLQEYLIELKQKLEEQKRLYHLENVEQLGRAIDEQRRRKKF